MVAILILAPQISRSTFVTVELATPAPIRGLAMGGDPALKNAGAASAGESDRLSGPGGRQWPVAIDPGFTLAVLIALGLPALYGWTWILRRKVAEHTRDRLDLYERTKQHHAAILLLAGHRDICRGNLAGALHAITETAAATIGVERASLWLLSADGRSLECLDLYEKPQQRHSRGMVLHIEEYPRYFEALGSQRAIDAYDAQSDPRTSEFLEHYLKPLDIRSMLDAPIRADGTVIGIICHEQIGRGRAWTPDEQGFAGSIADLASLALEVAKRKQAQDELARLNADLEAQVEARTAELGAANARLLAEIQERTQVEAELRESELRLRLSTKAANIGVWDWDLRNDSVVYSSEWKSQLGYADDEIANHYLEYEDRLHPDDKERAVAANRNYINGDADEYSTEFRLRHKDGTYRWIHSAGEVVARENGKAVRVMGCHVEITALKQAEDNLKVYRWFADSAGQGMGMASWNGKVIYLNPYLSQTLGAAVQDDIDLGSIEHYYPPQAASKLRSEVFPALQSKGQWIGELELQAKDGHLIPTLENFFVVQDEAGRPQYIADVITDISQQKAIERQLLRAKEIAESADRIKSMFVASMSHELRTPLNSIIGFTDVVLQGMSGELNERQKDQLGRVYRSAKHLLSLITDVIDISKVEAGYFDVYVETFLIQGVIEEVVHSVHHQAKQKGLEIQVSVVDDLSFTTDRKRFLQCVLNLLSNAVKYTERGRVEISVRFTDSLLEAMVSDTGIGIDPEGLARIFTPFERIDSHLKTITPGTGLGLYLTRKIARDILRGDIEVSSQTGRGSIFTLRLPELAPVPGEPDSGTNP